MIDINDYFWKPLLEASAQTIVGAISAYSFTKIISKITKQNTYIGPMDLWKRGILSQNIQEGDSINFDGLISPYSQLFPGDPFENAKRWNTLYNFQGKIDNSKFQAMEFFAGSDAALRIGSLNGESLVGLFDRYGYVGEGIIGIIPTKLLTQTYPSFFNPDCFGFRAMLSGKLSRCPSQHGFVAQTIASSVGIDIDMSHYKHLWYVQINSIKPYKLQYQKDVSLLGSPWAVTEAKKEQYLVQYGYIDNKDELEDCIKEIKTSKYWDKARVFFDDLQSPSNELTFKANYIS